jgi:ubiquinone/menaquinone biosynthesis C-methylase UbiE
MSNNEKAHICPWWLGYLLASPIRRLLQNPDPIISPYVKNGMHVLEIGPGMGFFSLPLAKFVGGTGRVICIDTQEKMVRGLIKRAAKAGLSERIDARVCPGTSLQIEDLSGKIDFALLFAVVHEVPDQKNLFVETYNAMRSGGVVLISEPAGHVTDKAFKYTLSLAQEAGFCVADTPQVKRSLSAILKKS